MGQRSPTLVGKRPLVFVSSTISELRLPRAEIEAAIHNLALVDEWLFEFHAISTGAPPPAQYLNVASSCDILVLIIGQEMSEPTKAEYERGYADNPDKILAFYVGSANDSVQGIRSIVDGRHTRTELADTTELAEAVAKAVETAVLTGRLVVPDLRRSYRDRLRRLDDLVGLDPPMSFVPFVEIPEQGVHERPHTLLLTEPRLAVLGIGGSGKTYAALSALITLCSDGFTLPLYVRAGGSITDIHGLIKSAFNAVRFQPGSDLIERYCREGRLALCVDGVDDLPTAARTELLEDVARFAGQFPRVRLLLLARSLELGSLSNFTRCEPARLQERTLAQLFELQGLDNFRVDRDVPKQVVDLVERPFWAGLLATLGLNAETGLVLLQRLIHRRLEAVVPHDEMRRLKLRFVLGELALRARPTIDISLSEGLTAVADAWRDPDVAARFAAEPAEALVVEARARSMPTGTGLSLYTHSSQRC